MLQVNAKTHPELAKVPNAIDFAPNENSKLLLKYGGHDPSAITRPYAVGPGTPKDRVQMLRTAFAATMKDPEFIADAGKSKLDLNYVSGAEIEQQVEKIYSVPPKVKQNLRFDAEAENELRQPMSREIRDKSHTIRSSLRVKRAM